MTISRFARRSLIAVEALSIKADDVAPNPKPVTALAERE
jgi:hypothetical protein